MANLLISNARIVTLHSVIHGSIFVKDGIIQEISQEPICVDHCHEINAKNNLVFPGFIDIQNNGMLGHDFLYATTKELEEICKFNLKAGVTMVVPTIITDSYKNHIKALKRIANYYKIQPQHLCQVLGIHMEGPFLNPIKKGAHNEDYMVKASKDVLNNYITASDNTLIMMTYAPELTDFSFTNYLTFNQIVPAVAHSNATCEQILKHADHGLKTVTHLFNGSSAVDHRNPGIPVAAFLNDEIDCGLIPDGLHVDKEVIKLIYKVKTANHIMLVTDCTPSTGMPDGIYQIGSLDVELKGEKAVIKGTNTLAASAILFNTCCQRMKKFTNCSFSEIARMASYNQAKKFNIHNKYGSIEQGKVANLTITDENFNVKHVIVNGIHSYKGEKHD
ncbi:MAG: N-acetylglucosamine-6-phosphate deacetylase [Mycoplasma sp.]